MSVEKRQFNRVCYQVPLLYEDRDEIYIGKINNISLHGIELREFPHFPQSKIFRVSFPLAVLKKLESLREEELKRFCSTDENGPKTVAVYLELMRKQWDPDQVQSKGSVIGGRFSNETEKFNNSIGLFFENYLGNIMFLKQKISQDPEVANYEWFKTLLKWMGIPIEVEGAQGVLHLKRYLEQNY